MPPVQRRQRPSRGDPPGAGAAPARRRRRVSAPNRGVPSCAPSPSPNPTRGRFRGRPVRSPPVGLPRPRRHLPGGGGERRAAARSRHWLIQRRCGAVASRPAPSRPSRSLPLPSRRIPPAPSRSPRVPPAPTAPSPSLPAGAALPPYSGAVPSRALTARCRAAPLPSGRAGPGQRPPARGPPGPQRGAAACGGGRARGAIFPRFPRALTSQLCN